MAAIRFIMVREDSVVDESDEFIGGGKAFQSFPPDGGLRFIHFRGEWRGKTVRGNGKMGRHFGGGRAPGKSEKEQRQCNRRKLEPARVALGA